ncbi:MAG: murein biosynthesis integral membrane protein MurJ [Aminipila sp.]
MNIKNKVLNSVQIAMFMVVLTMGSKFIGFIREMVLAGFFGTSYIVDVYVMSFTILSVLFGGVISAISIAYMPLFSKISESEGEKQGDIFTSQIINLFLIISLIISIIGILFSDQIIAICAQGFSGEKSTLGSFYIKVLFSYIIFSSIAAILDSYLQYKGIFLPQIVSGYFISISIIIGIIISAYTNHYYLAFGTVIGYALRCITIFYITKRNGYNYCRSIRLGDNTKALIKLALPVFIGSYITSINLFIDKTLASKLVEGSIAALNYASLLNGMIISITTTILSTIIYPKLTQANSMEEYGRFNSITSTGITIIVILGVPFALGAMVYSDQVIQIVYERGAFGEVATVMTSSAFKFYAIGLIFTALNDFSIRIYYSIHDMKSPMFFGAISVVINIILNVILVKIMGHNGLALATSIAAICNTVLLIGGIKYKYPKIQIVSSKQKLIKIILSAIIAIGISYVVYRMVINYLATYIYLRIIQLLIAIIIAVSAYVICLKVGKIEELGLVTKVFKMKNI